MRLYRPASPLQGGCSLAPHGFDDHGAADAVAPALGDVVVRAVGTPEVTGNRGANY